MENLENHFLFFFHLPQLKTYVPLLHLCRDELVNGFGSFDF
jgi:hypothetical protein